MVKFDEHKVIRIGKITKLAVPPSHRKVYKSQCKCEKFSQQALAWIIHTTGDYFDGEKPQGMLAHGY